MVIIYRYYIFGCSGNYYNIRLESKNKLVVRKKATITQILFNCYFHFFLPFHVYKTVTFYQSVYGIGCIRMPAIYAWPYTNLYLFPTKKTYAAVQHTWTCVIGTCWRTMSRIHLWTVGPYHVIQSLHGTWIIIKKLTCYCLNV